MSELTARETAVAAKGPVGNLGGNWMTTPAEEAATLAAGMQGWQLYFLGRHGVLGDVDADVITAAAFFFPPDVVRRDWEAARALMTPDEAVRRYVALCHEWGRERLSGFDDAHRLAELARQVADSADVAGLPLFAGWRAAAVPADTPARCAHLMHVLREHRGDGHVALLVGAGLDGCEANVLATAVSGLDPAVLRDSRAWTAEQWRDAQGRLLGEGILAGDGSTTDDGARLHADIEHRTDALALESYRAVLTEDELDGLTQALRELARPVLRSGTLPFPNPMGLGDPGDDDRPSV